MGVGGEAEGCPLGWAGPLGHLYASQMFLLSISSFLGPWGAASPPQLCQHFAPQDSGLVEKEAVAPPFEMEQAALMIPEST